MFVILGANGNTGSVAAKTLLATGQAVRGVVRDVKKAAALAELGAEVVSADLEDAAALSAAFRGAAGVYLLSPPNTQASDLLAERTRTFTSLAEAARRAGVPHVVLLSSIGAQHPSGMGPIATVTAGERILKATGIPLSSVRAAYFVENWLAVLSAVKSDGVLPSFIAKDRRIEMVSTPDVGAVVAQTLLDGPRGDRVIELAGPEAASPSDVAAAFARILGRNVAVVEAPLAAVVPTFTSFGISPHVAELYREMYEAAAAGRLAFEGGRAELVRGKTSVEARLRALLD